MMPVSAFMWQCGSVHLISVCEHNSELMCYECNGVCLENCSLQNDLESKIFVVFLLRKKLGGHHREKIAPHVPCSKVKNVNMSIDFIVRENLGVSVKFSIM